MQNLSSLFALNGQTAIVTGGSGVLGSALAQGLAGAGARVVVIGRRLEACENVVRTIKANGGEALALACDVTSKSDLERALEQIQQRFGGIDILVNGAGGNQPAATVSPERSFFELDEQAVNTVFGLNFQGTLLPCQVFGSVMVSQGHGSIVNISSMASLRPLTRVVSYGAAKAAINNFTQWLAVHMAQEYDARIRVNAIAPGFFLTEQNRFLLTDEQGAPTARGQAILSHTPAGRYGQPEDLVGTLLWLVSPAAAFITGIVVPIDGGFAAFSGV
ncbi:SDR family oxidoreductase [Ktedonobacter racemifer]|uniref:Short-chain dehydrogenase/reductase SDR n=1 Tax=Ktedonobacter racemifer DSM 44963 TaxID=485913 RepID=D6TZB3_KTERA|nr:SDR family oxidoreductase [Ktedonobacter racemifer]EFH81903.1 short-chain dehydrogenase/reductase SDR [Ktedonobacter racemifer DSM 44963]